MEVTHDQLHHMLDRCYHAKPPVPLYIWGPTGVGKSQVVAERAEKWAAQEGLGYTVWNEMTKKEKVRAINDPTDLFIFSDIRLSQYDPSDLKGIPKIISDIDASEWHIPMLFKALGHPEARGVVFFDEMNLAPASILASCYQVIHDRQIGENPISKHVIMLGAGNRAEDRANVFDMPAPLKNRFGHVTLPVPSIRKWSNWAIQQEVDSKILGFLNFKPALLHSFKKGQKDPAFATPRAWATCSRMITGVKRASDVKDITCMIVGEGIGAEFGAFVKLSHKIKIDDILENPESVSKIKEVDVKWSVVTGVAEVYRRTKGKAKIAKVANCVCGVANALDIEFGILLMRLVARSKRDWVHDFLSAPLWDKVAKTYSKFLSDTEE